MTRAYALDGATRITTLSYLGIAFTYLLQVPVFGDLLGPMQLLGAGLIIAAGWFIAPTARAISSP
jgi:drug/metabolite transporter (DMT)-like permease